MTDARALFTAYLRQRADLDEPNLVVSPALAARLRSVPTTGAPVRPTASASNSVSPVNTSTPPRDTPSPPPVERPPTATRTWEQDAPPIPGPGLEIPVPDTNLFQADPLADRSMAELADLIRRCEQCALCRDRNQAVPGEGPAPAGLMVIGEGPGAREDETGRPFVGRAGELLTDILKAIGCPRETVFIGNIVKCRPPKNRAPERDEIQACLPYLHRQIALVQPKVILAMGGTAACTLLETRGSLGSLRNKVHRFRGVPVIVTYHPAALLRNPHWKKPTWDDVRIARRLLADH